MRSRATTRTLHPETCRRCLDLRCYRIRPLGWPWPAMRPPDLTFELAARLLASLRDFLRHSVVPCCALGRICNGHPASGVVKKINNLQISRFPSFLSRRALGLYDYGDSQQYTFYFWGLVFDKAVREVSVDQNQKVRRNIRRWSTTKAKAFPTIPAFYDSYVVFEVLGINFAS
jgi:hypothetical protein